AVAYGFARFVKGTANVGVLLGAGVALAFATGIRSHMALALTLALAIAWLSRPLVLHGAARVLRPLHGVVRLAFVGILIGVPAVAFTAIIGGPDVIIGQLVYRHQIMSREAVITGVSGLGSSLPARLTGDSPWEFVTFLPEGFFTALYRPLPFDIH